MLFLSIRLSANWPNRNSGCDAFTIMLCARDFRARRSLPITLPPLFVLEKQEHWYPPFFIILCAAFSEGWLARNHWLLNHIIDCISALLIFFFAVNTLDSSFYGMFFVAIYAMSPGLLNEFNSLNTRPLGLALLNLFLLLAWCIESIWANVVTAIFFGILIFYSHKLTMQQLWFILPGLSILQQDAQWASLMLLMYLGAFMFWPRGFKKILAAHAAIIRFWHLNWSDLGAHQIRQSKTYGDGKTHTSFYRGDWWLDFKAFCKDALHQNYFILPVSAMAIFSPLSDLQTFALTWIVMVYVSASSIHLCKPLRGIGLGRQYFKFALVPSLIFVASPVAFDNLLTLSTVFAATILQFRQYMKILFNVYGGDSDVKQSATSDQPLNDLMDLQTQDLHTCTMTIPHYLSDFYAYKTHRPVYWGAHSDVFDERLNNFFPILQLPLKHYFEDGVTHILLDSRYATPNELDIEDSSLVRAVGPYRYYSLRKIFGEDFKD